MAILEASSSSSYLSTTTIISLSVFFALLCACIVIGHLLQQRRWVNESIIALLLGLCFGVVVLLVTKFQNTQFQRFNEDLFFLYLLPPIIFNAGFQMKKKQFFKNFTTILLFGITGTVISFCLISFGAYVLLRIIGTRKLKMRDYLVIGAIFSATDSVCTLQVLNQDETPLLYSIVFGEGVINDATSIVLFNSVQSLDFTTISASTSLSILTTFLYLFFTSTALGIVFGLLSAYTTKSLYFGRHSTDREVALMMLMAYLSYMIAELFNLSGILTIFVCGIAMSHYTWHNVTESSRITTKHSFATISFIAETFIFIYVGVDAFDIEKWKTNNASVWTYIAVSSTLFALVLIGRAAFVFPIANIKNCFKARDSTKIGFSSQFIIWWAGLLRGAVTIALSYDQFGRSNIDKDLSHDYVLVMTSTTIVVVFSTVVFGSITKPMIEAVQLSGSNSKPAISDSTDQHAEDSTLLFLEHGDQYHTDVDERRSLRSSDDSTVHYYWRKFDDKFMRPVFGGRGVLPSIPASSSSG